MAFKRLSQLQKITGVEYVPVLFAGFAERFWPRGSRGNCAQAPFHVSLCVLARAATGGSNA
jgi:hypothetical protein